jgi:hypothetical protein
MGSYSAVHGKYVFNKALTASELNEVALECKCYDGFFKTSGGLSLNTSPRRRRKVTPDSQKFAEAKSTDEWKGFLQEETVQFAKDLVIAFGKKDTEVCGKVVCEHESGDFWKVEFSPSKITLYMGVRKFEVSKELSLQKVKTTIESMEWA